MSNEKKIGAQIFTRETDEKAKLVNSVEQAHPEMSLLQYVTEVCGHKCCKNWNREELIDEFGYGYVMHVSPKSEKKVEKVIRLK